MRMYKTHCPSRETLQQETQEGVASPPRTVLLSIMLRQLRAVRASDSAPCRILSPPSSCGRQRATATDGTANKSRTSVAFGPVSSCASLAPGEREQPSAPHTTGLYFTVVESACPLLPVARSARQDRDAASCALAIIITIVNVRGPLQTASLSGICRIGRVSRPCRVLAPPSSACILDTDSPVGLFANSYECSEPYRWVAAVTTCSCRAAHKAGGPLATITCRFLPAELQICHPNTY